jgi:transcriptional regulator with XRE-family HTH domain
MDKGARLAQLRGPKSQREIAERIGVKPQAVSNWERGLNAVDPDRLAALDAALNAGGEVIALYSPAHAGGVTLADIDEKLDWLIEGRLEIATLVTNQIAAAAETFERSLLRISAQIEALQQTRNGPSARARR